MPWSGRRPFCSPARKGGSCGTSMRRCAGCTGRQKHLVGAISVGRRSRLIASMRCRMLGFASLASSARKMGRNNGNNRLFWGTFGSVVALDVATKLVAVSELVPRQLPHAVLGETVRFTLVFNPGAAFGLY